VPKILVFYITGYGGYFRWGYDTYVALIFAISFYMGYQIIQQMAVILGEFEMVATDHFRIVSSKAFTFLKGIWLIIISFIIYFLCWIDQTFLLLSRGMTEEVKIMVLSDSTFQFAILAAFIAQVIFTLGVFVFSLWYNSRYGVSSLKGEFLKISSIINKLCSLYIYVIFYLIALYSIDSLACTLSAYYEPLTKIYYKIGYKTAPIVGTFWRYLVIGCVIILPAVTYFGFLGSLARNIESEELKKINYKILKANTLEEKNYLLSYVAEVRKTLRSISIIDYVARMALLTYLGIFVRELTTLH